MAAVLVSAPSSLGLRPCRFFYLECLSPVSPVIFLSSFKTLFRRHLLALLPAAFPKPPFPYTSGFVLLPLSLCYHILHIGPPLADKTLGDEDHVSGFLYTHCLVYSGIQEILVE